MNFQRLPEDEIVTLLKTRGQSGRSHGLELPTGIISAPDFATSHVEECFIQASHGFTRGQIIYHNGTKYALAVASSITTTGFLMVSSVENANKFCATIVGHLKDLKADLSPFVLVPGTIYYVSATTPGALTSTEPVISNPIFIADSDDSGWVIPYRPIDQSATGGGTTTVVVGAGPATVSIVDTECSALVAKWFMSVSDSPVTKLQTLTVVGTNLPGGACWNEYSMVGDTLNYEVEVFRNGAGCMELKVTNNETFPITVKFNKDKIT